MDDLKHEFLDVDEVKEGSSFVEALAKYYSDFSRNRFQKGEFAKKDVFKHVIKKAAAQESR